MINANESIARAVALKAAVEYSKDETPFSKQEIIEIADFFLVWLKKEKKGLL